MRAAWTVFALSAVVLASALGLERLIVPDIVPVAFAEEAQPSWAVMTAFVLRTIVLISAVVALLALSGFTALFLRRLSRGR